MGPQVTYDPQPDGDADPGEVVWGWVPYEEDASQGKDRPVLVLARQDGALLTLMLSSKDHAGPGTATAPVRASSGSTSAPAPGTGRAGRARCGSTG